MANSAILHRPALDAVLMVEKQIQAANSYPTRKELWQRQSKWSAPMMPMIKKGQSIEDAVAEAMKPTAYFFVDVTVPQLVPKAQFKDGMGKSQLTAKGVITK